MESEFLRLAIVFLPLFWLGNGAIDAAASTETLKMLPIKELAEPRNFPPALQQNPLVPVKRVPAKPAKGPGHLVRGLQGRCFTAVSSHYEYRLCPFDNATQRDVSFQMLAIFHGVVGVYNGWYTDSNATNFVAMSMPNGDPCPAKANSYRRSVVKLACANATSLMAVHESPVCQYNMLLGTPLVCHTQAMLVYPTLEGHYAKAWDSMHTMRRDGIINDSSYHLLLDNLLYRAQLLADTRAEAAAAAAAADVRNQTGQPIASHSQLAGDSAAASIASDAVGNSAAIERHQNRLSMDFVYQQINLLQKQVELRQAAQNRLDAVAPVVPGG